MNRNKTPFWYANFLRIEPEFDGDGYETGGQRVVYTDPVKAYANNSPSRGEADPQMFGTDIQYDRVLVMELPALPIDENSILWVGIEPTEPHNYVVKKVADSLNSVAYAIRQVDVGA